MTETSHAVPSHHDHFTAACRQQQQSVETQVQQQQQQQQAQDGAVRRSPPRCALQHGETFVARGATAADLAALFPK